MRHTFMGGLYGSDIVDIDEWSSMMALACFFPKQLYPLMNIDFNIIFAPICGCSTWMFQVAFQVVSFDFQPDWNQCSFRFSPPLVFKKMFSISISFPSGMKMFNLYTIYIYIDKYLCKYIYIYKYIGFIWLCPDSPRVDGKCFFHTALEVKDH